MGVVSHAGDALIDDRLVNDNFFIVNANSILRTGAGHAEVLLGPCAALWIDDNSSFRMISTALSDVRIDVLKGSVIVATGAMPKGTKLTLLLKGSVASVDRKGAYRFDAEPPRIQVLAGRITVQWDSRHIPVIAGRWLPLDGRVYARKFERNPDQLDNWSNRRAALLARLAGWQPADTNEPAPSADLGAVRIATKGEARQLPNLSGQVSTDLPPRPDSPRSGCGVGPWHVRAH